MTATNTKTHDYKVFMTDGSASVSVSSGNITPEVSCRFLEKGGIIFFPESPFAFSDEDREFLLSQKQAEADYHKNIAYRPREDRVTGYSAKSDEDAARFKRIISDFYKRVYSFHEQFLAPYAKNWQPDYTSFRPIEEKGRKMRLRARNDLLHVDSFPTRPIYGDRILRTFININPSQNRIWNTSETFEKLLDTYKSEAAAPGDLDKQPSTSMSPLTSIAKKLGLKVTNTSPYDNWMLNFHNFLKENEQFQATTRKDRWEFPPNSSWLVYTDMVSHSVLEGQYALEQTFIISKKDLVMPEKAPINLLKQTYSRV